MNERYAYPLSTRHFELLWAHVPVDNGLDNVSLRMSKADILILLKIGHFKIALTPPKRLLFPTHPSTIKMRLPCKRVIFRGDLNEPFNAN